MRCEACGCPIGEDRLIATNAGKIVCERCMRVLMEERRRRERGDKREG